jgi:hypothetical protein
MWCISSYFAWTQKEFKMADLGHAIADHLLTLANTVMRTDIALCTLLESDRIFISSSVGGFIPPGAEVEWKNLTMCGWVLTPENNEVLVVEDMKCDARCAPLVILC